MTTRAEILEMIAAYNAAEVAVLKKQSYTINGRSMSHADLEKIRAGRREWETKLKALDNRSRGYSLASFQS